MPEAAIHKDNSVPLGKDYIGSTRQFPIVQSIAQAEGKEPFPKDQLRLCVLPPDSGHHSGPYFRRNYINHRISILARDAKLYRLGKTPEASRLVRIISRHRSVCRAGRPR